MIFLQIYLRLNPDFRTEEPSHIWYIAAAELILIDPLLVIYIYSLLTGLVKGFFS